MNQYTQNPNQARDKMDEDEDEIANEQASRLKSLAEKVDSFVNKKGAASGAVFEE